MLTSEIIYFQPHFSHSREISLVYLIYTLFVIVLFFIFVL
jgi:hypothetical protein